MNKFHLFQYTSLNFRNVLIKHESMIKILIQHIHGKRIMQNCCVVQSTKWHPAVNSSFQTIVRRQNLNMGLERSFINNCGVPNAASCNVHNNNGFTVGKAVEHFGEYLMELGIPEPNESIEFFVAHILNSPTLHGIHPSRQLRGEQVLQLRDMVALREKRMPVQYILREWDFCDITLKMSPPVFIPRPETEELVGHIKKYIHKNNLHEANVLEVGCGTGAITLALLKEFSQLQGVAVDKTQAACDLTTINAQTLGLTDRLSVLHRDIDMHLSDVGQFSMIVSNPPYICTQDMGHLYRQVTGFEDHNALHGGRDGLDVVRLILEKAPSLLVDKGTVWLEVDTKHPHMLEGLVKNGDYPGLHYLHTIQDFTHRPRFCVLQKC